MNSLENVQDDLDECGLRVLDLMNESLSLSNQLQNQMQDGWLHLAKTRYILGHSVTSVAQFDQRDAHTTVPIEVAFGDEIPKFSVKMADSNGEATSVQECCIKSQKRFGILSPNCAKECERKFRQSIEVVCQLASVKAEIIVLQEKYRQLLAVKSCQKDIEI